MNRLAITRKFHLCDHCQQPIEGFPVFILHSSKKFSMAFHNDCASLILWEYLPTEVQQEYLKAD